MELTRLQEKKNIIFGIRRMKNLNINSTNKTVPTMKTEVDDEDMYSEEQENEENQEEIFSPTIKKRHFTDYLIIKENSKLKAAFDMFINLCVGYTCFLTMYTICFQAELNLLMTYISYFFEICFLADLVMNFLTEYRDPETYEVVRSISKIGKKYAFRGSFAFDFLAIIPFDVIISN